MKDVTPTSPDTTWRTPRFLFVLLAWVVLAFGIRIVGHLMSPIFIQSGTPSPLFSSTSRDWVELFVVPIFPPVCFFTAIAVGGPLLLGRTRWAAGVLTLLQLLLGAFLYTRISRPSQSHWYGSAMGTIVVLGFTPIYLIFTAPLQLLYRRFFLPPHRTPVAGSALAEKPSLGDEMNP